MIDKNHIKNLINKSNPILFEVGAADGYDTEEFISIFDDCDFRLYCFEPDSRNIESFKNRIKDPRVILTEKAIGNINGEVEFHTSVGKNIYSSSLREPAENLYKIWPELFGENSFDKNIVQCITLDKFLDDNNINNADFLWLDCQAAEDLVIEGGKKFFKILRCLYTEYSDAEIYQGEPNLDKILSMLPNYEIVEIFPNHTGDLRGGDVLLKNKELS